MTKKMEEDQCFIRQDLNQCGAGVAYYRLPKDIKDFINLCLEKHGPIEGIILTVDENKYDTNIGFVLKELKS